MKRAFKIFTIILAAALCIIAATFCGCSEKPSYQENSFYITRKGNYESGVSDLSYIFKLIVPESGNYGIKFMAEYSDGRVKTFEASVEADSSGSVQGFGSVTLEGAKNVSDKDIVNHFNISVVDIWKNEGVKDDTSYFAIAIAFGAVAVGAIAAGITLFVLGKKKERRDKNAEVK